MSDHTVLLNKILINAKILIDFFYY